MMFVIADFDAVALGTFARLLSAADIEADDGCTRRMGENDIAFVMPRRQPATPAHRLRRCRVFASAPWIASDEPCTSDFITSGSRRFSPASRVLSNWSSVWRDEDA